LTAGRTPWRPGTLGSSRRTTPTAARWNAAAARWNAAAARERRKAAHRDDADDEEPGLRVRVLFGEWSDSLARMEEPEHLPPAMPPPLRLLAPEPSPAPPPYEPGTGPEHVWPRWY